MRGRCLVGWVDEVLKRVPKSRWKQVSRPIFRFVSSFSLDLGGSLREGSLIEMDVRAVMIL